MGIKTPRLGGVLAILATALVGPTGCAPKVAPPPATIRRIAVLPPCDAAGAPVSPASPLIRLYPAPSQSLAAVLASAARNEIAHHGFEVVDELVLEMATGGRLPSSPEVAGEIVRTAKLDATALFMRVRRWEFPYPTMQTNEIIVALDVALVNPTIGQIVWQVRRPTKPVRLYGELSGGQAVAVAAEEVMKEVFASLRHRAPS